MRGNRSIDVQDLSRVNPAPRCQFVDAQQPFEGHIILLGNPEGAVPPSHPIDFQFFSRKRFGFSNRYFKFLADTQACPFKPVLLLYLLGGRAILLGKDP